MTRGGDRLAKCVAPGFGAKAESYLGYLLFGSFRGRPVVRTQSRDETG